MDKKNSNFSLIVFDSQKFPFAINLNRKTLKLIFFLFPAIFLITLLILALFTLSHKLELEDILKNEPKLIREIKAQRDTLENELKEIKAENVSILKKLSDTSSIKSEALLELFYTPIGYKNLIDKKLCALENFEILFDSNKVRFSFNLKNNFEGEKLSGYVHVMSYSKERIQFYPIQDSDSFDAIRYNQGESFTVSRFRPVIAEYNVSSLEKKFWFKITIFNRTGDLIAVHKTEEYFRP